MWQQRNKPFIIILWPKSHNFASNCKLDLCAACISIAFSMIWFWNLQKLFLSVFFFPSLFPPFFFFLTLFLWTANPCPVPFVIPENALLSEVDFYVGQNISIRCREGYQLKGQSVITCNADETWTPATAKCESKYIRYSSTGAWYFPERWWPQWYHTGACQHRCVSRALCLHAVVLEEASFCLLLPFGEVDHSERSRHIKAT